ncbi:MAG: LysM peptidoglycan-binding domain-containing protein [Siphonobacter sp.]
MRQIRILTVALSTATLSICSVGAQTDSTQTAVVAVDSVPSIDFQLVHERMTKLEKEIPLTHNDVTHQYVEFFTFRKPSFVKNMLERKALFFPIFEKYLAQYGLPDELKYLSLIESRLDPTIISYAGAGGLWQFMPRTARIDFKLRVDDYIDERFDPEKATQAACKYFLQLGRIFNNDWEMMLASYNTGPGNVLRAMKRSRKKTYWEVYNYLHKQTRGYVPQYAAIVYMMHYAKDHGILPDTVLKVMPYDTIHINSYVNLKTMAALGHIPYEKIRQLNPHILTDIIPSDTKEYTVRLPKGDLKYFYASRQTIMDSASRLPYTERMLLAAKQPEVSHEEDGEVVAAAEVDEEAIRVKPHKMTHEVRRGESLTKIARKYSVDDSDLKIWNHLGRQGRILAGQKLVIYKETPAQVASVGKGSTKTSSKNKHEARLGKARKYHTVQRGDTLWDISQRYGGIPIDKLKKMNGIKGNSVRPGQRLIVI